MTSADYSKMPTGELIRQWRQLSITHNRLIEEEEDAVENHKTETVDTRQDRNRRFTEVITATCRVMEEMCKRNAWQGDL